MSLDVAGGCMCGAVRYQATAQKLRVSACHCKMCLRWAGGPFFAVRCGDSPTFEQPELITRRRTSEWAERGFCSKCGSNLFWRLIDTDDYNMAAGTIDDLNQFSLAYEYFHDLKPSFYGFAQTTRQFSEAEILAQFSDDV